MNYNEQKYKLFFGFVFVVLLLLLGFFFHIKSTLFSSSLSRIFMFIPYQERKFVSKTLNSESRYLQHFKNMQRQLSADVHQSRVHLMQITFIDLIFSFMMIQIFIFACKAQFINIQQIVHLRSHRLMSVYQVRIWSLYYYTQFDEVKQPELFDYVE